MATCPHCDSEIPQNVSKCRYCTGAVKSADSIPGSGGEVFTGWIAFSIILGVICFFVSLFAGWGIGSAFKGLFWGAITGFVLVPVGLIWHFFSPGLQKDE